MAQMEADGYPLIVGPSLDKADRGRLIYLGKPSEKLPPLPHIVSPFDIRPNLLRRWGMFREADLLECERHEVAAPGDFTYRHRRRERANVKHATADTFSRRERT